MKEIDVVPTLPTRQLTIDNFNYSDISQAQTRILHQY